MGAAPHNIIDDYQTQLNSLIKEIESNHQIMKHSSNAIIKICDEQLDDNDELKDQIQTLKKAIQELESENKALKRDQVNEQIHHKLIRESNRDLKIEIDQLKEKVKVLEFDQYCTLNLVDELRNRLEKHGIDTDIYNDPELDSDESSTTDSDNEEEDKLGKLMKNEGIDTVQIYYLKGDPFSSEKKSYRSGPKWIKIMT